MLTPEQLAYLRQAPLGTAPNRIALAMAITRATQMQMQAATGIPQTYISRMKNGRYSSRLPGETMRTLANYFGCQIEDLFPAREPETASSEPQAVA
jgi:hypothetical protein